ncbi:hypothetical protein CAPTEDRAFT_116621, partial [Capitella teleta]
SWGGTLNQAVQTQVFTSVATFQGKMVSVKRVNKPFIYLTKEIIQELNDVQALNCYNLNSFIGACVDPNHICVISNYCTKGSLQDVLENDNIKLDRIFKLSFATDIAQGMAYLHNSPIKFHGRLKSSNVLIDARWTCKVADFGLRGFREGERLAHPLGDPAYFYHQLWIAPEHLRENPATRTGSPKGDVYSFAILLQEIAQRSAPFGDASDMADVIIEKVTAGRSPYCRPLIDPIEVEESLLDLMRICWEEIPAFRPNFSTIRDCLMKMNSGKNTGLVDQMMHMMEKYADHLEELVDARTQQLEEEQKKTEELLARMLPRSVAESLKRGQTVSPESFASVTIFFSDVVGFTALAAESSPMQVVDLLNDLYTCFDRILEAYDVYKVETIGDAYMVASGVPIRNEHKHAGEVSTMALDLMSAMTDFKIRHRPDRPLQIRVGIHTGPVVAGVVGLKMPRFCLFGDTVNFASRMESNSLPMRIHITEQCKKVLEEIGGFLITDRGHVALKGKGDVMTFWLTGKVNFSQSLPAETTADQPLTT